MQKSCGMQTLVAPPNSTHNKYVQCLLLEDKEYDNLDEEKDMSEAGEDDPDYKLNQ